MINKSKHPLYYVWTKMKARCKNPTDHKWEHYGARGIKVCDRWISSFEAFVEDMGERPEGTTLDRIEVNGDYEPGNCRWASYEEQANNKRNTVNLTYQGRTQSLTQWAREIGISKASLQNRFERGWSVEKALSTPPLPQQETILTWKGKTQTLKQWAAELGLNPTAISRRLKRGWDLDQALSTPSNRAA
jgi:hypothetical protein